MRFYRLLSFADRLQPGWAQWRSWRLRSKPTLKRATLFRREIRVHRCGAARCFVAVTAAPTRSEPTPDRRGQAQTAQRPHGSFAIEVDPCFRRKPIPALLSVVPVQLTKVPPNVGLQCLFDETHAESWILQWKVMASLHDFNLRPRAL